ncbi:hypothetical protein Vadar_002747 [Vaccinium darrowii]|uniref:Uncharacterized protein n=1 Tax=Vaccinium darrowii TaxID=229202 RepID=A0ACB7ZI22_9ERIC|nr:hypothetical protein Vadar_002747 [Vaccinium darrowii]
MVRPPCYERLNANMANSTEEEDLKKTGLRRVGKSCRLKWSNCSRHDNNFTPEEEDLIVRLHAAIGSRPFSKVLSDYANISSLPETGCTRIRPLYRGSKNSFIFNSKQFPNSEEASFSNFNPHLPTLTQPARENSALSFTWRDFLVDDPFPQAGDEQQQENEITGNYMKQEEKQNLAISDYEAHHLPAVHLLKPCWIDKTT